MNFSECISLEEITMLKRVIKIGEYAFANCERLVSITIPESVVQ